MRTNIITDIEHPTYDKEIRLKFDKELMEAYKKYYFMVYPRRKKFDLLPTAISLNKFTAMTRIAQAESKKKYGEFVTWALTDYWKVPQLNINDCELEVLFKWPTRTRRDYDNQLALKYYLDPIVKYGLLEDDSFHIIKSVAMKMEYEKSDLSKVEFIFRYN